MKTMLDQHIQRRRTFQQIYQRSVWGKNGVMPYFSSTHWNGEAEELYVDRMVDLLLHHSVELGRPLTLVDVGCGDFRIGKALLERLPDLMYVGCDIVPELVARHTANHQTDRVSFRTLDAVCNLLPEGDVCLVRQVFQQLPHEDVKEAIRHLNCPIVYVTEWQTGGGRDLKLGQPPFQLPAQEVFRISVSANQFMVTERFPLARGVVRKALPSATAASV